MQRKLIFVLIGLIVFSLLISPVGSAQAQDPQPPHRVVTPSAPPHYPPQGGVEEYGDLMAREDLPESAELQQSNLQSAVLLGPSGLSFRYVQTFGMPGVPYLADGDHINGPAGIFIDASDNLYVTELKGSRLLTFDDTGTNTQIIGHAGQPWHHDDFLSWPHDAAKDLDGNIWVVFNSTVKKFDNSGNMLLTIPEIDPWESGSDDYHFDSPNGIAFDSSGLMYIADTWNHRVQVYDVSGESPIYQTTIGETGVLGVNNAHFNQPFRIAFDSLNRLYVMDTGNYRVQRCTKSGSWTCVPFFGITANIGNDLDHLAWAVGITVDSSDNVFIADGDNYRVLKCTAAGVCSHFAGTNGERGSDNSHFFWPEDVGTDSAGNVFVSDLDNHRVQKFNSNGVYQSTVGEAGVPYLTDTSHINTPWGIALNSTGDMYVLESAGYRLLKLNAAGSQVWTVGEPGVYGSDNDHLSSWWAGLEGNPAVNAAGRIFVPDTSNDRVQIFNSNGTYYQTLGSWGTGNYEFSCPATIAISPVNGDVYVSDRCNQRIQVYTNALLYKATLGVTGVEGEDNSLFRWPGGMTVAANGDIFVADSENFRVQKCKFTTGTNYTCSTFAGETGMAPDGTYARIHPISIAVDASNRVYVVDDWNGRVMIYDNTGALLTTIGAWNGMDALSATGVAVDNAGNVYVTDQYNHRIQKFAPGVSGWVQSNINGFGDPGFGSALSMVVFNNQLYAGAGNWNGAGASIWRTNDGSSWSSVMTSGFGFPDTNPAVIGMAVFKGKLYAGTGWAGAAGQLWRSSDGTTWNQISGNGMGVSTGSIAVFAVYGDALYAATCGDADGAQIWRSTSGDSLSWTSVVTGGHTTTDNNCITSLKEFNGSLYAAVENEATGAQVWRSTTGSSGTWTKVNSSGFGSSNNDRVGGFAVFDDYLYIGTRNLATGAQLWRSSNGTDWSSVTTNGFEDVNNDKLESLFVFGGALYAGLNNGVTGLEVWRSTDGTTWSQDNQDGFGDGSNQSTLFSNEIVTFSNSLYMGVGNPATGVEIWKRLPTFADVPPTHMFWKYIEVFYNAGITTGCTQSPKNFCPLNNVTRGEMAVFLERAMGNPAPTPNPTGMFTDVPYAGQPASFQAFIEEFYNDGITTGCAANPLKYCPQNYVTRGEMAVFIERALGNFTPTPNSTGMFADVPYAGQPASFQAFIEQFYLDGITTGCAVNPLRYCPQNKVTRQEMAVFIVRAFGIPLP